MKEVFSEYSYIRERSLKDLRQKLDEVHKTIPELLQLENEYSNCQAMRITQNEEEIEKRIAEIDGQKVRLLQNAGLPSDYLDLKYECDICKDYGFLADGSYCACFHKKMFEKRNRASSLEGVSTQTFDLFDINVFPEEGGQRERMSSLRDICLDYCEKFPNNEKSNLFLIGNSGLGKTFLLNCIGKRILERGFSVIKLTANHFQQQVLSDIIGKKDFSVLRNWENVDLLLFDDLGCEPSVNSIIEQHFYSLINERGMLMKPMVLATNLNLEDIRSRYGERTFSRLFDTSKSRSLQLIGKDMRILRR